MARTLVTGASGFIAQQLILDLLEQGHAVRGTVRSAAKGEALKAALASHSNRASEIEFVEADLENDVGWAAAVDGAVPGPAELERLIAAPGSDAIAARARAHAEAGRPLHALFLTEVVLGRGGTHRDSLRVRKQVLEQLLSEAEATTRNAYEMDWLKYRLRKTQESLDRETSGS